MHKHVKKYKIVLKWLQIKLKRANLGPKSPNLAQKEHISGTITGIYLGQGAQPLGKGKTYLAYYRAQRAL